MTKKMGDKINRLLLCLVWVSSLSLAPTFILRIWDVIGDRMATRLYYTEIIVLCVAVFSIVMMTITVTETVLDD